MNGWRTGIVTGIDRANRLVGVRMDDGLNLALPRGLPYRGNPPPPLTRCAFAENGVGLLVCEGPLGERRVILHDDFTLVAAGSGYGDTPWRAVAGTAPRTISIADSQGAQEIVTTAVLNNFAYTAKDDNGVYAPTPPAGLWWSGRVMLGTATSALLTNYLARFGMQDDGAVDGFFFEFDSLTSAAWSFYGQLAGALTRNDAVAVPVTQTWTYLDLVLVAGVGLAAWVDGAGPYGGAANIPTTAVAYEPFAQVLTRNAAVKAAATDWQHLEWVAEIIDPAATGLDTFAERTPAVGFLV